MKVRGLKFTGLAPALITLVLCLLAPAVAAPIEAPKIVGTWKMSFAKSKFNSGQPLKSRILKWEWDGTTLKHTNHSVDAKGVKSTAIFSGKFDGKEYPVFDDGSKTPARFVRLKMVDPYTLDITSQKDGKDLTTYRHTISRDGKTDTITQTGATLDGQTGTDVLVYDRQ